METLALSLTIIIFNLLTYSTILIVNVLIWRKTRTELMPNQQQSREISHQVGQALLVQALFPLALSLLPTLLTLCTILAGGKGDEWLAVPYFQYWAGLVNPVTVILFVRQYRDVLLKKKNEENLPK
jgi:hypothetical protein